MATYARQPPKPIVGPVPLDSTGKPIQVGDEVVVKHGSVEILTCVGGIGYDCVYVPANNKRGPSYWDRISSIKCTLVRRK